MRDRWVEAALAAVMVLAAGCATTSPMGRTLRGEVPTEFLKNQAKRLAEEVEFVEDVNNRLTIVDEGAGSR